MEMLAKSSPQSGTENGGHIRLMIFSELWFVYNKTGIGKSEASGSQRP